MNKDDQERVTNTLNIAKRVLADAQQEITTLRRHLEIQNARVQVMELFGTALNATVTRSGGISTIDVVVRMNSIIEDIISDLEDMSKTEVEA